MIIKGYNLDLVAGRQQYAAYLRGYADRKMGRYAYAGTDSPDLIAAYERGYAEKTKELEAKD